MLNIVKNHRKTKTKAAAAMPMLLDFAPVVSSDSLISAASKKRDTPCMMKDTSRLLIRPILSTTSAAAAVPKI